MQNKGDTFFDEINTTDQSTDQLMKMIDAYDKKIVTDLKVGTKVEGNVARIGSEYVFVDIGSKNEAMVNISEFLDENNEPSVKAGDKIVAYIVSNNNGETMLSKSLGSSSAAIQELLDAQKERIPVQGKVTGVSKSGLNVKIMGHRGFCPISQIDIKFTEDVNVYLNKIYDFVITKVSEGGRNIVVSRIPLLEEVLETKIDALRNAIASKQVFRGKISRITDFGLFVEMTDVEGLVHISEVSWERANNLGDSFSVGQEVDYIILGIEKKQPLRNSKISLSIKQVVDNPWTTIASKISVGQSVQGKVTRLASFGAFVEVVPGVEGLVHVSEMSWGKRIHHPSEVVQEGTSVNVTVLAIDTTKRTISLSLKDVANDPWKDAELRFPVGAEVAGKVAKKTKYGYFIDLAESVTGLLVFSNIVADKKESLKDGDDIKVMVESIDLETRRISLSLGLKEAKEHQEEVSAYLNKQKAAPVTKATSNDTEFGAALLAALKKK
jgi:small subunit ribosomal protein S1